MSKVEVKLDRDGVRRMLQSQEMLSHVTAVAESMAEPDDVVVPYVGYDRAHALIRKGKADD